MISPYVSAHYYTYMYVCMFFYMGVATADFTTMNSVHVYVK